MGIIKLSEVAAPRIQEAPASPRVRRLDGAAPDSCSSWLRRLRRSWLALALALILIVGGTAWVLRSQAGSDVQGPTTGAAVSGGAEAAVVCLGYVDVQQGVISLFPAQSGRVVDVLVGDGKPIREGSPVKAGTALLRLEDQPASLTVRRAEAGVEAARARLSEARALPDQHRAEIAAQQAGVDAAQSELAAARFISDHKQHLQEAKQVSEAEASAAAELVKKLEAALDAERQKLRVLELRNPSAGVTLAGADLKARQTELEEARFALSECTLKAPVDGTVLRVLAGVGDQFGPGARQPALLFCPDAPRIIRADIEQEFATRVTVGQAAVIQDHAGGSGTWHGKVERIADWYTQRRAVVPEMLQLNESRTLECILTLEPAQDSPGQPPLRMGQKVRITLGR